MTAAAFQATYSDFKLIKTRGVVSISFEVPVEQAQTVLDVLGGMPVAASEVWCAIARLETAKEVVQPVGKRNHEVVETTISKAKPETPPRQEPSTPDGAKTKTAFKDMRMANQAGILCESVAFQRFLAERLKWAVCSNLEAADYVRKHCKVASRSFIRPRDVSGDRWQKLFDEYQVWMHAPEMVA